MTLWSGAWSASETLHCIAHGSALQVCKAASLKVQLRKNTVLSHWAASQHMASTCTPVCLIIVWFLLVVNDTRHSGLAWQLLCMLHYLCTPPPLYDADEATARQQHLEQTGLAQPKLPFGVTFISTAWRDEWLCKIASRFHEATGLGCGPEGHHVTPFRQSPLVNGSAKN